MAALWEIVSAVNWAATMAGLKAACLVVTTAHRWVGLWVARSADQMERSSAATMVACLADSTEWHWVGLLAVWMAVSLVVRLAPSTVVMTADR